MNTCGDENTVKITERAHFLLLLLRAVGFGEQKTKSLQLFSYRKLCAKPTLALKMSKPANILQALLRSFCLQISVYVEWDRYLAD